MQKARWVRKYIVPSSILGKWSVWLVVAFLVLVLGVGTLIVSIQVPRGDNMPWENPLLFGNMLLAGLCGIGSFITGIISIFKNKEHSIIVYFATLSGLLLIVFLIGEFSVPH